MEKYEIEALLKSNALSYELIEPNFAKVDNIQVDFSFSYLNNFSLAFKRLLSPENSLIISNNMSAEDILSSLNELKSEQIITDFSLSKKEDDYQVIHNDKLISNVKINFVKNQYFFEEKTLSNLKPDKRILSQKIMEDLNLESISYLSKSLYKENYFIEKIDKSILSYKLMISTDIFFNDIIFTFENHNFIKVS